jgi:hypothetical protein
MKWDALSVDEQQRHLPILHSNPEKCVAIADWPQPRKELYLHSFTDLSFVEGYFVSKLFGFKVKIKIQWESTTLLYTGYAKSFGKNRLDGRPTVALCVEMSEEVAA